MRVNPNFAPNILNNVWQSQSQRRPRWKAVDWPARKHAVRRSRAFAADIQNQAEQSQDDQYLQNTTSLEGLFQTADSTLSSVVTSLNQAISLGTQGANGTMIASDQQALALQVQAIQARWFSWEIRPIKGITSSPAPPRPRQPFVLDPSQAVGCQL